LSTPSQYKLCSICRKPIDFGKSYFQCSVSTCNRGKVALFFCTLECWNAHLPDARHREAWAEPVTAPSREAWEREQAAEAEAERTRAQAKGTHKDAPIRPAAPGAPVPKEVLIVVSKAKDYVKQRSTMSTSDGIFDRLSDRIRRLCDEAIDNAARDGRRTVLDRDVRRPLASPRVIRRPGT
jgi:hypothetical protein